MNNLVNYIYGILMFVILISILDMLLPKSNNAKYVKLVSGFLLTFIVLTPIINIFVNKSDIDKKIEDGLSKLDISSSSIETMNQQVYIDTLFEEGIKNDISSIVNEIGYVTSNVDIEYNKNEKGEFTNITKININILSENKESTKIGDVKKVSIMLNDEENEKNKENILTQDDKQIILENISNRYMIDKSNIYIN